MGNPIIAAGPGLYDALVSASGFGED